MVHPQELNVLPPAAAEQFPAASRSLQPQYPISQCSRHTLFKSKATDRQISMHEKPSLENVDMRIGKPNIWPVKNQLLSGALETTSEQDHDHSKQQTGKNMHVETAEIVSNSESAPPINNCTDTVLALGGVTDDNVSLRTESTVLPLPESHVSTDREEHGVSSHHNGRYDGQHTDVARDTNPRKVRDSVPRILRARKQRTVAKSSELETEAQPTDVDSAPSQEDLAKILLWRMQREKQARVADNSRSLAKEIQLEQIKREIKALSTEVQELRSRTKLQTLELDKYHESVPKWKDMVRNLHKYLKGLGNDQKSLRDDTSRLWSDYEALKTDKIMSDKTLHDTYKQREQDSKNIIAKSEQHIEMLEQTVRDQKETGDETVALLQAERQRDQSLEGAIRGLSVCQQQFMDLMQKQHDEGADKLHTFFRQCESSIDEAAMNRRTAMHDMLNRCVTLLEELDNKENVGVKDVQQLDAAVESCSKLYVPLNTSTKPPNV